MSRATAPRSALHRGALGGLGRAATRAVMGAVLGLAAYVAVGSLVLGLYIRHKPALMVDTVTIIVGVCMGAIIWAARLRARYAVPFIALFVAVLYAQHVWVYIVGGEASLYVPLVILQSTCAAAAGAMCAWALRLWEARQARTAG